jgi:hypothetical protein
MQNPNGWQVLPETSFKIASVEVAFMSIRNGA